MGIFSPGTDTTTSTFTPVQAGQIQELLQGASGQFQKGFFDPSVFNQSGVAGFTPQQLQALQQQEAQARSLSRFTPQAESGIQQLLSGQINPIFEQQAQQQAMMDGMAQGAGTGAAQVVSSNLSQPQE